MRTSYTAASRLTPCLLLLALLAYCLPVAFAAEPDGLQKIRNISAGIPVQWSGSVRGAFTDNVEGTGKLRFYPGKGQAKMVVTLTSEHVNMSVSGVIACPSSPRSYPLLEGIWKDTGVPGEITASMRDKLGRAPGQRDRLDSRNDGYWPRSGTVTVAYVDDELEVTFDARMRTMVRAGNPAEATARFQVRVARTLENEHLFVGVECQDDPGFRVTRVSPEDGQQNVLSYEPGIELTFSHPIDPDSLANRQAIQVYTELAVKNDQGEPFRERLSGRWEPVDERTVRFRPAGDPRPAVHYRIEAAAGSDGPRGKDFETLEAPFISNFSTAVEPDELRMHVYQTTRDAPLLVDKPTVARVYVDWEAAKDVAEAWQVLEYEADVELHSENTDRVLLREEKVKVKRPDQYDDEDRRVAEDTVNLFGWSPGDKRSTDLMVRVRPSPWYPEDRDPEWTEGRHSVEYARNQVESFSVESYVVLAREWRDDPPGAGMHQQVASALAADNAFARQIFPVLNVRGRHAGIFTPPGFDGGDSSSWDIQLALLHDHVGRHSSADILVGYYPPSFDGGQGEGIAGVGGGHPERLSNVVGMTSAGMGAGLPAFATVPLVAHEYGHVFGLAHHPDPSSRAQREQTCQGLYHKGVQDIEGFRIARNGSTGWSKSSTTGNAEHLDRLQHLMFPCIYDRHAWFWIRDEDYLRLVDRLPMILEGQRGLRSLRSTALSQNVERNVSFQHPGGTRLVLASGMVSRGEAELLPLVDVPVAGEIPGEPGVSGHTLRLEGAAGESLAEYPVPRVAGDDEAWYFSLVLPADERATRVVLLDAGREVAHLSGGPAPDAPRITSHADGDRLQAGDKLRWAAGTKGLRYSVRYRPDETSPWQTLAALVTGTSLTLPVSALAAGEAPSLLVVAHGGLAQSQTPLRIQLPQAQSAPPTTTRPASTGTGSITLQVDRELSLPVRASHCVPELDNDGLLVEGLLQLPDQSPGTLTLRREQDRLLLDLSSRNQQSPFATQASARFDGNGELLAGGNLTQARVEQGQWTVAGNLPLGSNSAAFKLRLDCR